ncbi:MAG: HesA/MoeB/ThiF family protein [Planctomycetota bacterium]|jgi:adenylyltransferase/sulfurtransferase
MSVLIVGAGGLGAPVIRILRGAGVSGITVVDPDTVALENLHRQVLFTDADVGRKKVDVIAERFGLDARAVRLDDATGPDLVRGRGCVIDGTDNFADKYRINDLCLGENVPLVHAAAAQFRGQVLLVRRGGPCLRCLLPDPPDNVTDECRTTGIFGPAAGLVAALAASEALRALSGDTDPSPLLLADLASGRLRRTRLLPTRGCVCSGAPSAILLG